MYYLYTTTNQTCGTGGFITDALDLLNEWHENKEMKAPAVIVPYGEELSGVTWAMGKANLLIRNVSDDQKDVYDQNQGFIRAYRKRRHSFR